MGSSPIQVAIFASVAQSVEQRTENPRVVGSIPTGGTTVGVFNVEGTPVPIPNTEVKLYSGDNTRLETAREDNTMPTQYADLAHLVERDLAKVEVAGSSPVIRSIGWANECLPILHRMVIILYGDIAKR